MKALIPALAFLATLASGCGAAKQSESTLASAASVSVNGATKIRVIEKHDYVSLELKGVELFTAIWNFLDVEAVTQGEDAAYTVSKEGAEFTCSASTEVGDLDIENFEDPSCVVNLTRAGKAGVKNDDPWAWADAPIKSKDIFTTARLKNGKLWIDISPSSDTGILWDALTGVAEQDDLDEEIKHKRGPDIRVDYEYADGDDFFGMFQIDGNGELTAQ